MISVWVILYLMLFHWVGDFILQTHDMATKKSTCNGWLTYHVFVYTIVMSIASISLFDIRFGILWSVINGYFHWNTDYLTSRWSSYFFKKNDYHNGFVVVGFDQLIHLMCILLTTLVFMKVV